VPRHIVPDMVLLDAALQAGMALVAALEPALLVQADLALVAVAGAGGFGPGGFGTGVAGAGGFGAGTVTTLGANAPFGAAVNTVQGGIAGTQFAGGQFAGGNVTTVQGAPIYVGQPYAAYYGVPQLRGAAAALPFALTAGIGTNFDIGGDFFTEKPAGPATTGTGGLSAGRTVSALDSISYNQAFDSGIRYDLGAEFDVNQDTTLLSRIGYSQADGKRNNIGTVTEGGTTADLFAEFSDLEQYSIEGGVRKYVGGPNVGLRPYVGALGGFVYTDDVDVTQSSTAFAGGDETQQYLDGGWSPTATGVIGAEWQVGPRSAIGIESGIRWQDNGDTNFESKDRWSIPLSLRGRVAF